MVTLVSTGWRVLNQVSGLHYVIMALSKQPDRKWPPIGG